MTDFLSIFLIFFCSILPLIKGYFNDVIVSESIQSILEFGDNTSSTVSLYNINNDDLIEWISSFEQPFLQLDLNFDRELLKRLLSEHRHAEQIHIFGLKDRQYFSDFLSIEMKPWSKYIFVELEGHNPIESFKEIALRSSFDPPGLFWNIWWIRWNGHIQTGLDNNHDCPLGYGHCASKTVFYNQITPIRPFSSMISSIEERSKFKFQNSRSIVHIATVHQASRMPHMYDLHRSIDVIEYAYVVIEFDKNVKVQNKGQNKGQNSDIFGHLSRPFESKIWICIAITLGCSTVIFFTNGLVFSKVMKKGAFGYTLRKLMEIFRVMRFPYRLDTWTGKTLALVIKTGFALLFIPYAWVLIDNYKRSEMSISRGQRSFNRFEESWYIMPHFRKYQSPEPMPYEIIPMMNNENLDDIDKWIKLTGDCMSYLQSGFKPSGYNGTLKCIGSRVALERYIDLRFFRPIMYDLPALKENIWIAKRRNSAVGSDVLRQMDRYTESGVYDYEKENMKGDKILFFKFRKLYSNKAIAVVLNILLIMYEFTTLILILEKIADLLIRHNWKKIETMKFLQIQSIGFIVFLLADIGICIWKYVESGRKSCVHLAGLLFGLGNLMVFVLSTRFLRKFDWKLASSIFWRLVACIWMGLAIVLRFDLGLKFGTFKIFANIDWIYDLEVFNWPKESLLFSVVAALTPY